MRCLPFVSATVTELMFRFCKSSDAAIFVYPVRGADASRGGRGLELESAPKWARGERRRWRVKSIATTIAMVWIVAGF
jgi:hypothetical protein